jgi:hypothetical protein
MTDPIKRTFADTKVGDVFWVPTPWPDIPDSHYMVVAGAGGPFNVVHVGTWRAGTLDCLLDTAPVVVYSHINRYIPNTSKY